VSTTVLISPAELADRLSDPRLRILDVRWTVTAPDGRGDYLKGHIPGAVYVDLDTELADHSVTGRGRHPLPTAAQLQAHARTWGLDDGDPVVVYDAWGGQAASRAWWLLRAAGLTDVRILDGGWPAWVAAGLPVETDVHQPDLGSVEISSLDGMRTVEADDVARLAHDPAARALDARAGARYRGEEEPLDPVAGHIPGAVSAPTAENLTPDGRFRPAEDLRARFCELKGDADAVAVYCGSGVTATHQIAALALAGIDAALYPGSWSEWSNTPGRPVATGPDRG
jgi:thiosulfate/3-mercaptopyruvate sulfurtransferase